MNAGYQWRQLGDLHFQTGSSASGFDLPWMAGRGLSGQQTQSSPGSSTSTPFGTASPGASTTISDRTYDDGYVGLDAGTSTFGDTWNWGYQNSSQLSGNTLSFQAVSGTTTTSSASSTQNFQSYWQASGSSLRDDLGWDSSLSGSGWFATVESPAIFTKYGVSASLEFGYSFVATGASNRTDGAFNAFQTLGQSTLSRSFLTTTSSTSTTTITDAYDVTGLIIPGAPYNGSASVPGTLISNTPASRTTDTVNTSTTSSKPAGEQANVSTNTVLFFSNISESLDLDLHTISLGPRFSKEWRRLRLGGSTGFALNIANWSADYSEQLFAADGAGSAALLRVWRSHNSGIDVLPGFYLESSLSLQITRRLALYGAGRYDWARDLHGEVGPSSFSLDVKGWTVSGGFSFTF